MDASKEIDNLISRNQDWRGETLSLLRKVILAAEPGIIEEWKWMGSPVWSKEGIICVGNIFKDKVKLVFMNGANFLDEEKIFNADLGGNQRRAIEWHEGEQIDAKKLTTLINAAVDFNQSKKKK